MAWSVTGACQPTGAAATGTWTAYRLLPDGMLKTIPGKGILKRDIEDTILQGASRRPPDRQTSGT